VTPSARVPLSQVTAFLDEYLHIDTIPDEPNALNGLQVENAGWVGSVVAAVDATQATINGVNDALAAHTGPPLLLVHHGLFWGGNEAVTGRRYRRIRGLLDRDIALYSAHIPLDLHPEVGNNQVLARRLEFNIQGSFGVYRDVELGVWGHVPPRLSSRAALVQELARILPTGGILPRLIAGGPETVHRVGIVTGSAGDMINSALESGLDTFITGEGAHHTYFDAMELGINVVYAGHYATESLGVQALAARVGAEFGLEWEFHDHPTGL
jgi:dinuclear metal center YbgI/SA1388 family protein